ncbi:MULTISPECIES: magnesium chelatase subunit D [unclassified Roseobacter]|uniref:magnesium chelatase subunit D n=1 Tax=unclassified Roseobacter TaxID=196798 RepID=UPI0030EDED6B
MTPAQDRWASFNLAIALFAIDPAPLGGIWLRARVGPVRDRIIQALNTALETDFFPRLHPKFSDEALFGGLDLSATLATGRPIQTEGLLNKGGTVILTMAERAESALLARLAGALDAETGLSIIALDEAAKEGEGLRLSLSDRLGLHLQLDAIPQSAAQEMEFDGTALAEARARLPHVRHAPDDYRDLCLVAEALGVTSLRAVQHALRLARHSAALMGSDQVEQADLQLAVELALAPRATQIPEPAPPEQSPPPQPQEPEAQQSPSDPEDPQKVGEDLPSFEALIEAAKAMLPADLLARLAAQRATRQSKGSSGTGNRKKGNHRGRPVASRSGELGGGARIDLMATLRSAAPWQGLRAQTTAPKPRGLHIRKSDIRVKQFEQSSDRVIIFVVDASGSSAMSRMAEAKGAIELMLAEAYARRDHVALVAFRGAGADILLNPTRSLVQTKRRLQDLPGGGGTPLAAGLKSALDLAVLTIGKGMTPSIAVLTDGRANVSLDGSANRAQAGEDANSMAKALRGRGVPAIVIDTGQRPTRGLDDLAKVMGAAYVPLPRADAKSLSAAVEAALPSA